MKMLNGNLCCETVINRVTKAGIEIPEATTQYRVLKIVEGEGIEKGKTIYVPINAGTDVKINDEDYVIVNISQVILILD